MRKGTMKKSKVKLTAKEFDRRAEAGEDLADQFDWDASTKPITVEFPVWILNELMTEAKRRGIGRTSLIKVWITEKLDSMKHKKAA